MSALEDGGRVIPVEILGQRYPIRSSLEQEYVARLAAYVDEKVRAAAEATPTGDSARVLVPVSYRARDLRPAYVSWSADGRTLYYLALDSLDRASIWEIDPVTADQRMLVRFGESGHDWHRYGFAAFGGRFYFTLGDRQSDLWMTSIAEGR